MRTSVCVCVIEWGREESTMFLRVERSGDRDADGKQTSGHRQTVADRLNIGLIIQRI